MTWATKAEAIAACAEYGIEPEVVFQLSDGTWYAGDECQAPE
jgi:hypothetical protein